MTRLIRRLASISLATVLIAHLTGCATSQSLLDGREKSFLIVGYSTSYAWPDMLQEMLDDHSDGLRVYHVLNAVVGGAAVERWIGEPGSETYKRTITPMLRDYFGPDARLRGDAPEARVALCQQSLQFTRDLRGPVKSADDTEGIRIGADALEKLAVRLNKLGIDRVYYGMHIYKKPVEPEVGNERIALSALLERGHAFVYQGPDVWTPTRDGFPDVYDADGLHPNEEGMKIMAEGWYRTVAGPKAREDVIATMHEKSYDVRTMMRAYIAKRRGDKTSQTPRDHRAAQVAIAASSQ